jgi:GNAT superfamily N-acetyltransferase
MITVHFETLAERLEEIKPLLPLHYKELALNQDDVPLDPQYEIYLEREAKGELLFTVLRERGEMVGYFLGFIAPGLHYKTCLTCTMDIFFIREDKRKQGAGIMLFQEVEKELKRRGVQRWFMGSKMHKDASYLFEKIGAIPVEMYYSKWLGI